MRPATRFTVALCAATLLPGSVAAQRSEPHAQDAAPASRAARPASEQATAVQRGPVAERARAGEHGAAAEREAAARKGKARHAAAGEHRTLAAEIARAETAQRGRLAKLKRLMTLAEQQGQTERMKELEALQQRAIQHHEQLLATLRERLGDGGKAAMERAVGRGRETSAKTATERRHALEKWSQEHPGRSHGVARRGHKQAAAREAGRGAEKVLRGHEGKVPTAAERRAATERERARKKTSHVRDGGGNARDGGRDG